MNVLPTRVPIGEFKGADGRMVPVYQTTAFARALADVFQMLGGNDGISLEDIAFLASAGGESQNAGQVPEILADAPTGQAATAAVMQQQIDGLQMLLGGLAGGFAAALAGIRQDLEGVTLQASHRDPFRVDWERPGKIGSLTANSGAFTTLSASGAVTLSPANANVVLSPAGTGVVTINPATLGAMDKVAIGGTTPAAGAFTTLSAAAAVTFNPANASLSFAPTGTGTVTINPATVGALNNLNIGATTPKTGAFTTLSSSGVATLNGVTVGGGTSNFYADAANAAIRPTGAGGIYFQNSAGAVTWAIVTVLGIQVTAGFGCNGKTPQTAVASGAALTAYAAGANGLAVAGDMQALVVKVAAIDTALKANGILS